MTYLYHIFFLITLYAALGVALELLAGQAGLLALSHAAFFGIGAYSSAILSLETSISPILGAAIGMLLAAILSIAVSLPSLRVHDDFFTIVTFGFQVIVFSAMNNWLEVTRGPLGLPGIPRPNILNGSELAWVAAGLLLLGVSYAVVVTLTMSPFGRVLRAIREDEAFAAAVGKNTRDFKVKAVLISACLAAAAGSLYAHYSTYIDPTSFSVNESIFMLSIIIVGGAGNPKGALLGAATLVGLPEGLRLLDIPTALAANIRQVMYGSLLVVMMIVRPRGFVGKYSFERFTK